MGPRTATVIMAAGRGSRMKTYEGNKTLLPLVPQNDPFTGRRPILRHILSCLPEGPKAVIVNYKSEDIKNETRHLNLTYCHQPELNGTGGAILAARDFLARQTCEYLVITMGDVPFVREATYRRLIEQLSAHHLVVLGFIPKDKKQYGVLEIQKDRVEKITEWAYWKDYTAKRQANLHICNSGIYAARRNDFIRYLDLLESRPQVVVKARAGVAVEIKEYFITDIVEYMNEDRLSVGYALADDENETMGVDDLPALAKAQAFYAGKFLPAAGEPG